MYLVMYNRTVVTRFMTFPSPHVVGILTQRWQLLRKPMMGKPANIENKVAAMTVLHNYLLINNDDTYLPPGTADMVTGGREAGDLGRWRAVAGSEHLPQAGATAIRNFTAVAAAARDSFTEYFSTEGAVDWQYDHINRRPARL